MSSRKALRVLDDCLAFDADMYRKVLFEEENASAEQRRTSREVQASIEVLRQALHSCVEGDRDFTPALAHRHARQKLRSEEMLTTADSLLHAGLNGKRLKHARPKRIIRMSRELLEQALPLVNFLEYEPSDELPDRCVPASLIVEELLSEVYFEARLPERNPTVTGQVVLHELGMSGSERADRILQKHFGDDEYFLSAPAFASAALLESRRIFSQQKYGNLTMGNALPMIRPVKDWHLDA